MAPTLPRIKLCGVTTPEDAEYAAALGVWAIGVNFWPRSARRCDPALAAEIAAAVKRRVEVVGVFVNPTLEHVAATAEAVGLTMVQLHGDEGPAFCAETARRTGCKVIKAARVHSGADIQALSAFHVDYHLLDSHVPGERGGTGETFAWELARRHRGRVPLILSGGLTPENVAEAIATVRPFAVDVASGVESAPGRKDPAKVEAFVNAVAATSAVQALGPTVESDGADSVASSPGGELPGTAAEAPERAA
ncbi:MAG TPA: phosphoribosylanthranilate isomerase [Solirubrobacteraceae bacterium]|jgi:phosphoribosylanthranilate isomerase|nr:phosphoribosylanthranilate isomerase [Solirubrobacteraceae bacterium]